MSRLAALAELVLPVCRFAGKFLAHEGGEKFFGNSFVYFTWFAVNLPRRAGEKCGDRKINFE